MSFFNDAQRDGLLTGRYICSECGGLMEFEDEWEDTLVCLLAVTPLIWSIMAWRMMKNMMPYTRPEIRSATTN